MGNTKKEPLAIAPLSEFAELVMDMIKAAPPAPPDKWLSLQEAAAEFGERGINPATLRKLAASGKIPCRNLGTANKAMYFFSRNELSRWLGGEGWI